MKHYIIGAGGGGSWLAPSMAMLVGKERVCVVDGDTLEKGNLNRQLFTEADIGSNKAAALGKRYDIEYIDGWYSAALIDHYASDWIFGCVDNMPARASILDACDMYRCKAIIAGNETTSAEAFFYQPQWKGTTLDPRVYYPSITQDHGGDPSRPETCTGEAQLRTPQLVSANLMAIALAQWLFVFWGMKLQELDLDIDDSNFPYLLRSNMTRLETLRLCDATKQEKK